MAIRFFIKFTIIFTTFCMLFVATPASALGNTETRTTIPELNTFVKLVSNGQEGVLRGIYVEDLMALRITQQPAGNDMFVSPIKGFLTEFRAASKYGNIGLLTHNYLSGEVFSQLLPGQKIQLIYGNGEVKTFIVTDIQQYQAKSPNSVNSDFINLDTKKQVTASTLFTNTYGNGTGNLVLQTCIYADQNPTWGRLFVIAEPV